MAALCAPGHSFDPVAASSVTSDVIALLPELAVAHRSGVGFGVPQRRTRNARVAVMAGSFGSARPGPMAVVSRVNFRRENLRFIGGAARSRVRKWQCPLSYAYEVELFSGSAADDGTDDGPLSSSSSLSSGERRSLTALERLIDDERCSVVLMDLFTTDLMKGHRSVFLRAVRRITRERRVLLVIDETMTSVRCGRVFSFQWYGDAVVPDLIVVGKAWKAGILFAVDRPVGFDRWSRLGGSITWQIDEVTVRRTLHFVRIVRGERLAENCVRIGEWIRQNCAPSTHASRDNRRYAFLRGIGAMWYTNLAFRDPDVNASIRFHRLLPLLTATASELSLQLRPTPDGSLNAVRE